MKVKTIEAGQIVYCKLTVKTAKNKIFTEDKISLAAPWSGFDPLLKFDNVDDKRVIQKFGLSENVTIIEIDIHHVSGYKSKTNQFTEVKKSDEKRNTVTGSYD